MMEYPFPNTPWIQDDSVRSWRDFRLAEIRDKFERKKLKVGHAGLSFVGPTKSRVLFEPRNRSKVKERL